MSQKFYIVTGGLGFIGKHFIKRCLELGNFVTNIDTVNYAADRTVMEEFSQHKDYRLIKEDIAELKHFPESDVLVNFAAESHVDNSIADNRQFSHSNFFGVQKLLELTRSRDVNDRPLFVQVSTDEVYGDITSGAHTTADVLKPSNPYSATKAAADMLVLGWGRTYGIVHNIIRLSNNYGPHQYPEKLIPKSSWRMSRGLPALMHGSGSYVRSWLHAEDSVDAILTVIEKGERNTIYNACGDDDLPNIEVLRQLASIFNLSEEEAFKAVDDRVGQDLRYSLDDSGLRELGWKPKRIFDEELKKIALNVDMKRFI